MSISPAAQTVELRLHVEGYDQTCCKDVRYREVHNEIVIDHAKLGVRQERVEYQNVTRERGDNYEYHQDSREHVEGRGCLVLKLG